MVPEFVGKNEVFGVAPQRTCGQLLPFLFCTVLPEEQHHCIGRTDQSAVIVFRHSKLVACSLFAELTKLPANVYRASVKINIRPAQAQSLALPHTGKQSDKIQRGIGVWVTLQLMDHCCNLLIRQRLYVRSGNPGEITDISGVIAQITDQYRLL